MGAKFEKDGLNLTKDVLAYVRANSVTESDTQVQIRRETAQRTDGGMMIAPSQGQLMSVLMRMIRPRRIVEVGVFTGYSASWLVPTLADDGLLVACDINADSMAIARGYWEQEGLLSKIRSEVGPAADSLQKLLDEGWEGSVDAMFVDADKTGYPNYFELGLKLLRPGGVFLFDNMLWGGSVVDKRNQEPDTVALRALAAQLHGDARVDFSLLTHADGIGLAVKR